MPGSWVHEVPEKPARSRAASIPALPTYTLSFTYADASSSSRGTARWGGVSVLAYGDGFRRDQRRVEHDVLVAGLRRRVLGEVAGRQVAVLPSTGPAGAPRSRTCPRLPAAGTEAAAGGRVDGRGDVTGEADALAALRLVAVGLGDGGQKGVGVGVTRAAVDGVAVADLDDLAEVHDRDALREVPHDGQVVGDEEERDAQLLLDLLRRLTTWAWMETSSAETGSSATISFGSGPARGRRRCAGAGRRRTRAGSGCSARG